jgi:hypothetical protein
MNCQLLAKGAGSAPLLERLCQAFEERRAGELAPKKAKLKLAGRGSGRHRDRIRGERLGAGIGARSWKGGRHDGWCRQGLRSAPASRARESCRCRRRSVCCRTATTSRQNKVVRVRRTQLRTSANDKRINRGPRTNENPLRKKGAHEWRRHGIGETVFEGINRKRSSRLLPR